MKIYDINGREISINITKSKYDINKESKSKFQEKVKEVLLAKYPYEIILEDFVIPSSRLSVDFFIPRIKIVIEVNGKQHFSYLPRFHGYKEEKKFANQVKNDILKARWAENNSFKFININNLEDIEGLID